MKHMEPHEKHCNSNHNGDAFFKGLFWGAVAGAILGVMFAPDKGEETRKKLKKLAEEYEEKGHEAAKTAKVEFNKAKTKYEKIMEEAEPIIEEAKDKIAKIEKQVEKEVGKDKGPVLDALQDLEDTVDDEAHKIRKRFFKGTRRR